MKSRNKKPLSRKKMHHSKKKPPSPKTHVLYEQLLNIIKQKKSEEDATAVALIQRIKELNEISQRQHEIYTEMGVDIPQSAHQINLDAIHEGRTLLLWAVLKQKTSIVEALLAANANPDIQDKHKKTALLHAIEKSFIRIASALIDANAKLNVRDIYRKTPLHHAAANGLRPVVKKLLDAKAKLNIKDNEGSTPLHSAENADRFGVVKILLEAKADVDSRNAQGENVLMNAIRRGVEGKKMAHLLVTEAKVNFDGVNLMGQTALHIAASCDNVDMARKLVEAKANPDVPDNMGKTPLITSMERGCQDIARFFICKTTADINKPNEHKQTPLSIAAHNNYLFLARHLLAQDRLKPNIADANGKTPLLRAIEQGHADLAILLIADPRVNVNLWDRLNVSPIYHVVQNSYSWPRRLEVVTKFLDRSDIIPDASPLRGRETVLTAALRRQADYNDAQSEAVIKTLVSNEKVNCDLQDGVRGDSPLMLAAQRNDVPLLAALIHERRVQLEKVNDSNCSALDVAIVSGSLLAIRYLLEQGALIRDLQKLLECLERVDQREVEYVYDLVMQHAKSFLQPEDPLRVRIELNVKNLKAVMTQERTDLCDVMLAAIGPVFSLDVLKLIASYDNVLERQDLFYHRDMAAVMKRILLPSVVVHRPPKPKKSAVVPVVNASPVQPVVQLAESKVTLFAVRERQVVMKEKKPAKRCVIM